MHSFKAILLCLLVIATIAVTNGQDSYCKLCTNGIKDPDRTVEVQGESITCGNAEKGVAFTPADGSYCSTMIKHFAPCCSGSASSTISSMVAFVTIAWIGYMVAF